MISILVNTVLASKPLKEENESELYRIIWINEDATYVYMIALSGYCPMPKGIIMDRLKNEIENGDLVAVEDPYLIAMDESSIPMKYKELRDSNWNIVNRLWNENDKNILIKERRMQLIRETAEVFNTYHMKVLRLMSRFWQRGMNKNALLPDYTNSSGKGNEKGDNGKKRGKPKKPSYFGEVQEGINVTDNIKSKIRMAIDLFYRNNKRKSIAETYTCMLERFFADISFVDGKEVIRVWDKDKIINYNQFYYWFRKEMNLKKDTILRNGEKEFLLRYRELMGNATIETFGPGSRYEIDATPADVYIVSGINTDRVIGRPVIYAVIDVYSRLIVGVYVGLEGPSWIGAMMALDNVVSDKVEFCKSYGIEITEDFWPQAYLPETILADRGEFEGYNPENLINNLNVKIENTAPYRGDLKGIVERRFRTINEKVKHTTPGAIMKEYRQRGEKDPRLKAALTLKEFTAIIIIQIIHHNKNLLDKYPRELGMLSDDVMPIPLHMWKWGIKNRKCAFVKRDRDIIRLNLLPRGKATLTREGIKFRKMYYSCEKALEEQWFVEPEKRVLEFVYDPRNLNYIYIPDKRGREFVKCFLLDKSFSYKDFEYEEIIYQQELENEQFEELRHNQLQNDVELEHNINRIIKNAEQRTKNEIPMTGRKRLKNIKENRSKEKEHNRIAENFELAENNQKSLKATVTDMNEIKYPDENTMHAGKDTKSKLELLRKMRDEKLGK